MRSLRPSQSRVTLVWPVRYCLFAAIFLGGPAANDGYAQTATLTFRPGPGANNGTDEGSAAAGKDASYLTSGGQYPEHDVTNNGSSGLFHHFNSDCNGWEARNYYQFDVSSLPAADVVTNVKLVLYQRVGNSYGYQLASTTMVVQAVTVPWNEMTLTFNTRPAVSAAVEASVTYANNGGAGGNPPVFNGIAFSGFVMLDITALYKDWRNGTRPNFGFSYRRPLQICENGNYNFTSSSDNTNESERPALLITYPVLTDTTPPVIAHPNELTVEATSPAGAVVTYSASALDDVDGVVAVTCTPPSGSTFLVGTTTVTCSAFDTSGNVANSFFDVFVDVNPPPPPPPVTLEGLLALIDSFVDNPGIANSLKVKVRNIANAPTPGARAGALGAFRNQVAAQTGKALTADEAALLLSLVGQL